MRFQNVELSLIDCGKNTRFEPDPELQDLAESIDDHDVLQPVVVVPNGQRFKLVAGHRRVAACKRLNLPHIPAIVRTDLSEADIPILNVVENAQRKNLTAGETVAALDELRKRLGVQKKVLAFLLRKIEGWINDQYRAAKIEDELIDEGVSETIVKELGPTKLIEIGKAARKVDRPTIARKVHEQKLSVREVKPFVAGTIHEAPVHHQVDNDPAPRAPAISFGVDERNFVIRVLCRDKNALDLAVKTLKAVQDQVKAEAAAEAKA